MATGTVKWFNTAKGYGFITPDEGEMDLFVHHSQITGGGYKSLGEGARVEFEAREGQKGPEAIAIEAEGVVVVGAGASARQRHGTRARRRTRRSVLTVDPLVGFERPEEDWSNESRLEVIDRLDEAATAVAVTLAQFIELLETASEDDVSAREDGLAGQAFALETAREVRLFASDPAWRDHPIVREVLEETLRLQELIAFDPSGSDPDWKIREVVNQISDLLRILRDEIAQTALDDPTVAAHYVATALSDVDQTAVAEILDVDPRTLRTWRGEAVTVRKNPDRIVLVARLVNELLRGFTPYGAAAWFKRPRHQLRGDSPVDLINRDPLSAYEPLLELARGGHAQLGT